jgi:hypothetical protein
MDFVAVVRRRTGMIAPERFEPAAGHLDMVLVQYPENGG